MQMKKQYPDKEIIPAGILYYGMNDPLISLECSESEYAINEKILSELKPKGLINSAEEALVLFDEVKQGSSNVAPVGYNKDGSLKKNSDVISTEDFGNLMEYTDKKIEQLAENMYQGTTYGNPYRLASSNACSYCSYQTICGFDTAIEGCEYRELEVMKDEDVFTHIREQIAQNDENGGDK